MFESVRNLAGILLVVCVMQAMPTSACAQFGGSRINRPLNRPTVTPYLGLAGNRNGRSSIINYYGVVRPQQQAHQQSRQLNRNLRDFERDVSSPSTNNNKRLRRPMISGTTGHRTAFLTIGGGASGSGLSGQQSARGGGDDEGNYGSSGHSAGFGSGPGFSGAQYTAGRFGSGN